MRDAAERALARVEHSKRHKAWCRDELGPALKRTMDEIYYRRTMQEKIDREDELFADEQYGKFRARMGPHWRPENVKKVQKPIQRRVVVVGRSKTTKVGETPKTIRPMKYDRELVCEGKPKATVLPKPTLPPPTNDGHNSRILDWMEEVPKPMLGNKQPQECRLRKIDILAEEEEGVPLPRLEGQPQAFRLARRTDWAKLRREVLQEEFVACRQDFGRHVDEEDSGDATFLTHQDWEQRLAGTPSRRQEQLQPVQAEEEEHSTGIVGTIKTWATRVFRKVKMALWG